MKPHMAQNSTESQPVSSDSKSTTVVHLPPPMRKRAFYLMLARAKQLEAAGEQILLTHCGLKAGTCFSNVVGNPLVCAVCQFSTRKSVSGTGLPLVTLTSPKQDSVPADQIPVPTLDDGKEIAIGVRSALTSIFRVLTKDLNRVPKLREIKRHYFQSGIELLAAFERQLDQKHVGRIEVPNGRMACTKFALVSARKRELEFNTLDFNGAGRPMLFRGHSPHNREAIQARVLRNPADIDFATQWFDARRDRSTNKFAAQHQSFSPPEPHEGCGKRVTFFLSSQDECESLGRAWHSIFRNNSAIVRDACRANPDYHFCVRFHPNQAGILSDIETDFRLLAPLSNLTIYYPQDPIDTYQLVQWSELVVAFQSTIALEAAWMRKPVIQLGPSFYDSLGIAETPSTIEEFLHLLRQDLKPRCSKAAAKFAYYAVNDYDQLPHLHYKQGNVHPIGFRRAGSLLAKPAKELNARVVKYLKRSIKSQLENARKAA